MKDSEFIELLNLYLDHEITPADAARLEAEVQSNAARRRVYQDYCRMQKACKLLADDFATEPTEVPDRKVVAFEQATEARARRSKLVYFGSGIAAAAACVAVLFVARTHQAPAVTAGDVVAVQQPSLPAEQPPQVVAANTTVTPVSEQRVAAVIPLRASATSDALAIKPSVQNDPHFAWMQDVRLAPVQLNNEVQQIKFEVSPSLRTDNRTYSSKQPLSDEISRTSFRFQR